MADREASERREFKRVLSEAHRSVRYWIAQTQTRVLRSVLIACTAWIYQRVVATWPIAVPLASILTSKDGNDLQDFDPAYLVLLWLLFSTCDAIWLAYWWIEASPHTSRLLGRWSTLKFAFLRALVIKPALALIAALAYGPVLGWVLPHRASLNDLVTLSSSLSNPATLVSMFWNIQMLSFRTGLQTVFSLLITASLMLWIDGNYGFVYFIDPSEQALRWNGVWIELPYGMTHVDDI